MNRRGALPGVRTLLTVTIATPSRAKVFIHHCYCTGHCDCLSPPANYTSAGNYCPLCGECYSDNDFDSKVSVGQLLLDCMIHSTLFYRWSNVANVITGFMLRVRA